MTFILDSVRHCGAKSLSLGKNPLQSRYSFWQLRWQLPVCCRTNLCSPPVECPMVEVAEPELPSFQALVSLTMALAVRGRAMVPGFRRPAAKSTEPVIPPWFRAPVSPRTLLCHLPGARRSVRSHIRVCSRLPDKRTSSLIISPPQRRVEKIRS